MYLAVEKGLRTVVQFLVKKCAINVDARTTSEPNCGFPLHVAISFGHIGVIDELVNELHANVNIVDPTTGYSALFSAVYFQCEGVVNMLIKAGANYNIVSRQGRLPIYAACEKG